MIEQIGMLIQGMLDLLHKYPVQLMGAWAFGQWTFGVVVDSLPEPKPDGNPWYKFSYKVLHGLAGNKSEFQKKF